MTKLARKALITSGGESVCKPNVMHHRRRQISEYQFMTVLVAIDVFADNLPYFFHPLALCRLAAHDPGGVPDKDVFIETAGASRLQNSPENLEDLTDRAGVKVCEGEA